MPKPNIEPKKFSIDISDLCNLLQCLGFNILLTKKVLNKSALHNRRIIEITCNTSGIEVMLESITNDCNCPELENIDGNEKWEVSGTSGGIQTSKKENNPTFKRNLSDKIIMHVQNEIQNLIKLLHNKSIELSPLNKKSTKVAQNTPQKNMDSNLNNNFSISSSCLISPPNLAKQIKISTPSRYRSLDSLNDTDFKIDALPEPRILSNSQKSILQDSDLNIDNKEKENSTTNLKTIIRQNTYTTSPTKNLANSQQILPTRTSSPITTLPPVAIFNLHQAENITENLLSLIQETIKSIDFGNKSSTSLINVSKITTSKSQMLAPLASSESMLSTKSALPYTSSPNLNRAKNIPIPLNVSKRKLSYSPAVNKLEIKTNSLKRAIPKKFSSVNNLSPTLSISNKKNLGLSSVLGKKIVGSYKSLIDRNSFQNTGASTSRSSFKTKNLKVENELEMNKKNKLYNHIKSTIPKQISSVKK